MVLSGVYIILSLQRGRRTRGEGLQGIILLRSDLILQLLSTDLKNIVFAVVELIKEGATPDHSQHSQ